MTAHRPIAPTIVRSAHLGDPSDNARIHGFVEAHVHATPFHRPQWSRAVERGTGQRAHYLLAERAGTVSGVLPLTHMRSVLFGSALVSAGFAVGGGVLAADEASAERLVAAAVELAERLGCPSIELRGGAIPDGWGRREAIHAGFTRDLPGDEAAILAAIPRKQRAEVRRALGRGMQVTIGRDAALHYRVYAESVRNLGTPVFPLRLFDEMLEAFGEDSDILTVKERGVPLASVLSVYCNGIVHPYWGGGTFPARGARANELMYFALMRHAAARGCTRFDFGRSKIGTGAYAYKKNWGFVPTPLAYAVHGAPRDINPLSARYRLQTAMWKRLPLWAANIIGPPIARGLG